MTTTTQEHEMARRRRRPSPALVVAMVALFAALAGYATAATAVPLAKRALKADSATKALVADNAKTLNGRTLQQVLTTAANAADTIAQDAAKGAAEIPGPASSIAGLLTIKTAPWSFPPDGYGEVTARCDAGQKAVSGGYDDPQGWAHAWDTHPSSDGGGWAVFVSVAKDAPSAQTGRIFAVCVK